MQGVMGGSKMTVGLEAADLMLVANEKATTVFVVDIQDKMG